MAKLDARGGVRRAGRGVRGGRRGPYPRAGRQVARSSWWVAIGLCAIITVGCGENGAADGRTGVEIPSIGPASAVPCPSGGKESLARRGSDVVTTALVLRSAEGLEGQPASVFSAVRRSEGSSRVQPRKDTVHRGRLFRVHKLLLVVDGRRDVIVSVREDNATRAALFYPTTTAAVARVQDGDQAIRLEGCGGFRGFPGGILSTGRQCLKLDVWVVGQAAPKLVQLPLGVSCQD